MNKYIGSSFDDFLKEEKIFDEVEAVAVKKVLAYQVQKLLGKNRLTKSQLALQMNTSRAVIDRVLDPTNTSITLKTAVKIAHILGKKVNLSFV